MTHEQMRNLERLVEWRLARWRDRGDYDDMRQEALIAAWKAVEKTRDMGYELSTIAVRAADYAAREWLRSPKSDLPHYGWRRGYAPPEVVSVDELAAAQQRLEEMIGHPITTLEPAAPDFTVDLLDEMDRRAAWVKALGTATPRQAAVLRAAFREGLSQQQIADATGRSWSAIAQLMARAKVRCRSVGLGDEG